MTALLLNNRYQILQTLGRGGFGETFLAVDTHLPSARKCVIKQLQPAIEAAPTPVWLQERFQREATILEELGQNHPQIPQLYAYFSEGGNFFLVQEWIEGITLNQKHQQQGDLSEAEVGKILRELLPVLDYIHSHNIIHRDIKPDNIILRASDGKPVLIDFGIVKEAIATAINVSAKAPYSVALGTPGYMASEQAAGRPVYSSDLYSLGLTAIFLLTGKTPQYLASDPHTGEILWRKDAPHLHSNLAAVIDRAVRFHPRDRFTSAKEMLAALQAPPEPLTGATVVVAPSEMHLSRQRPKAAPPTNLKTAAPPNTDWEETETNNPWVNWLLWALLLSGTIAGGLAFGYMLMNKAGLIIPRPSPSPVETFDTNPQNFPTPEPREPTVREPQRQQERPRPQPETTVTPAPENNPAPTPQPEVNVTPTPEVTVTPQPEVTVTPQPEVTVTPQPEVTVTPQPQATSSPPSVEPSQPPAPTTTKITPEPPPAPPQPKINPEN